MRIGEEDESLNIGVHHRQATSESNVNTILFQNIRYILGAIALQYLKYTKRSQNL